MPSTQQLFDFVNFYISIIGQDRRFHPDSSPLDGMHKRYALIETKINPRTDADEKRPMFLPSALLNHGLFAQAVATVIKINSLESRADIQSFDFRTLLIVQEQYPEIRTVLSIW